MRLITGLIKRNPKLFEFVKFGIVGGIALFILYLVYYYVDITYPILLGIW